jgi:hypothetical protein
MYVTFSTINSTYDLPPKCKHWPLSGGKQQNKTECKCKDTYLMMAQ